MDPSRQEAKHGGALCTRTLLLREGDGGYSELTVSIDAPAPTTRGYCCHFSIVGKSIDERHDANGIDGFQALKMALVGIRSKLDQIRGELSWLNQPGFTGFPRIVNDGFGLEFLTKCERMIEAEEAQLHVDLAAKRSGRTPPNP